jgi:hypothetical protein
MSDVLKDGDYQIPVTLKGGSGRAGISSPADVHVDNNKTTAEIIWSSPNYDYMKVDGKKYLKTNKSGNSTFEIPIDDISKPVDVIGDTTAMSKPYEIEYTITFDTAKAEKVGDSSSNVKYVAIPVMIACFVVGIVIGIRVSRKIKKAKSND